MYIYDYMLPKLNISLTEPKLLRYWVTNLPFQEMSRLWGLNPALGDAWYEHMRTKISNPHWVNAETIGGVLRGAAIPAITIEKNKRLFDAWMASNTNIEIFAVTKLSKFISPNMGIRRVLLLAPDVLCTNCDREEPAFLYHGTHDDYQAWHPKYKHISKVLNEGLNQLNIDLNSCNVCCLEDEQPSIYFTPQMSTHARCMASSCTCMPCRGSL